MYVCVCICVQVKWSRKGYIHTRWRMFGRCVAWNDRNAYFDFLTWKLYNGYFSHIQYVPVHCTLVSVHDCQIKLLHTYNTYMYMYICNCMYDVSCDIVCTCTCFPQRRKVSITSKTRGVSCSLYQIRAGQNYVCMPRCLKWQETLVTSIYVHEDIRACVYSLNLSEKVYMYIVGMLMNRIMRPSLGTKYIYSMGSQNYDV